MKYHYTSDSKLIHRFISFSDDKPYSSSIAANTELLANPSEDSYFKAWLQSQKKPVNDLNRGAIRVVDLFCGCGGLTLGISEACRAMGYQFVPVLGADMDMDALNLYIKNFSPHCSISTPIENYIDSDLGAGLSIHENEFCNMVGNIDILIGGPPCQGNSDLNNHTRRNDPRNLLYLRMIRCVEITKPRFVIVENVPGVQHDSHSVVEVAKTELQKLGYYVDSGTIDMSRIGVPQKRKRFLLIASREKEVSIQRAVESNTSAFKPVSWAIDDLLDVCDDSVFNTPANSSETNKRRIDYLFDNDIYDLPNSERPDCHRLKNHSYTAVYGRMHWNLPSPTITGGFGSNGQGRFVHPKRRRTLTPHEAARIQFFPDFFSFDGVKRRELQQIIGNAVPSKASFIIGIEFLGEESGKR